MAFADYIGYIVPGIKAITNFFKNLQDKKADDGKVDIGEFFECLGQLVGEIFQVVEPIIRDEKK